ncbi:hypothetical protein QF046_002946 [Microbacterium sp. W4I4]|uniref:hypothetical protein n=1 Tax=Microbacterium sp. W4I4 TaxID=3042295 RepID=UPI002785802F|nr:hypothetical protein [Microbacterium sp. W4I4]MDQ0615305.1 hypothetical protein [Microbacterium sp. W4I4]
MEEAKSRATGAVWDAEDFAALSSGERSALRDTLVCTACGADAYFIREARNGRRACFGARPHRDDCELASFVTEDGGGAPLDEVDELINAGDAFRIDPNRARTIKHVRHDPFAPATSGGSAVRYVRRGRGNVRQSSMGIGRLLRQLVLREPFRRSRTLLTMSDGSRQTVRSGCVHLSEIEDKHSNRLRVYWGTIRFPKPKEDGGAWLNTGWRSPTIVIGEDELTTLLERAGLEDLDDLSGAFFAFMGKLRQAASGKQYFFINQNVDWVAVRPFVDDEDLN